MRIFRVLLAFIFALVTAAGIVAFIWHSKVTQFEKTLESRLTLLTGGQVTYSQLIRFMNPTEFRVLLKDVVYKLEDVQSGNVIKYTVGDVDINSDLLGNGDLSITVASQQTVEAIHNGEKRTFNVKMKGGELALHRRGSAANQLFSADSVSVVDALSGEIVAEVDNAYLSYADGVAEGALWEVSASHLDVKASRLQDPIKNLSFVWSFDHTQKTSLPHLVSAILLENTESIDQILADYIRYAAINESFIHVKGMSYKLGDFWLTFNGDIGVARDYSFYPYGAMSFTTNNLELVLDRLRSKNYIQNMPLKQHRMLTRMMLQKQPSYNVNVGVNRGALLLNGAPSGDAPFMGNILGVSHLLELKE